MITTYVVPIIAVINNQSYYVMLIELILINLTFIFQDPTVMGTKLMLFNDIHYFHQSTL